MSNVLAMRHLDLPILSDNDSWLLSIEFENLSAYFDCVRCLSNVLLRSVSIVRIEGGFDDIAFPFRVNNQMHRFLFYRCYLECNLLTNFTFRYSLYLS